MTAKQYKQHKNLRKESPRDNMDNIELILTDLGEESTKRLASKLKPIGLKENIKVTQDGGSVAKTARKSLEKKLKENVISSDNKLDYKHDSSQEVLIEKDAN